MPIHKYVLATFATVAVALLLSSCLVDSRREEYLDFKQIPYATWSPNEPVCFSFLCPKVGNTYSAELVVRHNSDYKYTSIKLRATLRLRGNVIRTDTISGALAKKPMRWNGSGVALVNCSLPLYTHLQLKQSGIYSIELEPLLWKASLSGVESVGIRLWRSI